MKNKNFKWETLNKSKTQNTKLKSEDVVNILLKNRGINTKEEKEDFFNPKKPGRLGLKELGIGKECVNKAIKRVDKAVKNNEEIIIYGDYDADGICATAILWEALYSLTEKVKPYIPNRFDEGYGLNIDSVEKLKAQNSRLKLIITVDNGIVAYEAVEKANDLGIDVIITDHHQKEKKLPKAHSIVHTNKISGSGVAWIFAREILQKQKNKKIETKDQLLSSGLELCAIGTIADQMPLLEPNRSFAKYGLEDLNSTKRPGLLALFNEAGINFQSGSLKNTKIETYSVNFVVAPRINAMGRLDHAIDSLRLLCTKSGQKAKELAAFLGRTNTKRQRIVDEVVTHARKVAQGKSWKGAIVLADGTYHEGVIGLAASKLVEEFGRPAIVLSKGKKISKASARSIAGFDIIDAIKKLDDLILGGGGHPMAAGFSIETSKIDIFKKKFEKLSASLLTEKVLEKKLRVDMEIEFMHLNQELIREIEKFEPFGIGNPSPVFSTKKVNVVSTRLVGSGGKHLKLVLEKGGIVFNAIAFGKGECLPKLVSGSGVDIAYNLAWDLWSGKGAMQLKIKDLKV